MPRSSVNRRSFVAESPWVRRVPKPHARVRLVCFPFAGGGASIYSRLADALPQSVEMIAVQLPGREDRSREQPPSSVPSLASAVSVALLPYADFPMAFYGHCAGALLAHEVAHEIRNRYGIRAVHLFAGAQGAPHLNRAARVRPLHSMSDSGMLFELANRGGLPDSVAANEDLVNMLVPLLRADFALWENYSFGEHPRLDIPITTLRDPEDPFCDAGAIAAWEEYTSDEFNSVLVRGGHYFITSCEQQVGNVISEMLVDTDSPLVSRKRRSA